MPEALVVGIVRQSIETAIVVSMPMLLAGLVAGVLVSVFQTITSIQDNVLAFIPRALAIFAAFALTFPWVLRVLSAFSIDIIRRLPEFLRVNDITSLSSFVLLLIRPGALVALAPVLGGATLPAPVKVALTVLLGIVLAPVVPVPAIPEPVPLLILVARELAIGTSLAFVVRALVAAAEFGGHLASQQIGFSYNATVDPQNGVRNTMLATLYGLLATLGLLAVNAHHMVLRALAASYAGVPLGRGQVDESLVTSVRQVLGLVMGAGLRIAAPVVITMLVIEIAVGLISRAAPALTVQVIGYPIRIIAGLFAVGLTLATVPRVANGLLETALTLAATMAAAFR